MPKMDSLSSVAIAAINCAETNGLIRMFPGTPFMAHLLALSPVM